MFNSTVSKDSDDTNLLITRPPDITQTEAPPPYEASHSRSTDNHFHKKFEISVDKSGKPVVSLTLYADQTLSKNIATILQGQPLEGIIALHLDSPNPISSVDVLVEGKYMLGGVTGLEKTTVFLDHKETLWSEADGKPPNSTINSAVTSPSGSHFKGTLHGEYTWPISIKLPEQVELASKHEPEPQMFSLPQSFTERFIRATVSYILSIKISRQGFLKDDYLLTLPFNYLRLTRPPSFSPLRQISYQEGTPISGPSIDRDGWYSKGDIQIEGKLSKVIDFTAKCTLYLAKPLSYTGGAFIPLCIKIECDNPLVLDLLSSPQSIHTRVRRQIIDHSQNNNIADNGSFRECLDYSQRAVWWASNETLQTTGNVRVLNGELHLKPGMKPNTELGNFKLNYSIMLYDFSAVGLEFREQKFLQEIPFEICTFHALGPRPRPVTTPNYDPDVPYGKLIVPYMNAFSKGFY